MRRAIVAGALALLVACSSGGGSSKASTSPSSTTTTGIGLPTTLGVGEIPAQSVDPTATDNESGGRAFARLYAAGLRQQASGMIDDTQTQCVEDKLIEAFGGARLLALANTTYATMPAADFQLLVQVLKGCGLTDATLERVGVSPTGQSS
jgi:hypothetical protein